jgi:hypothetical protein
MPGRRDPPRGAPIAVLECCAAAIHDPAANPSQPPVSITFLDNLK